MEFNRFKTGDVVMYNGEYGIVTQETHAPFIDKSTLYLGVYHVHLPCGIETINGDYLVPSTVEEALFDSNKKADTQDTQEEADDGVTDFDARFALFFDGCVQINKKHMDLDLPTLPYDKFTFKKGRRYVKVIRSGSAHCFVDTTNGDVLKAASWNSPAKHSRGNIFDDNNGLGSMGEYGPAYLRG